MKTIKVIHKRMETRNTIIGAKAKCGLLEFHIDEENLTIGDGIRLLVRIVLN